MEEQHQNTDSARGPADGRAEAHSNYIRSTPHQCDQRGGTKEEVIQAAFSSARMVSVPTRRNSTQTGIKRAAGNRRLALSR